LDLPDVSFSGKSEICEGEQVTLYATGARTINGYMTLNI
jgi:hypothetical protein